LKIEQIKGAGSFGLAPNRFKGVSSVNEFQMHLKWLAEQRRLQDLERRWREAERVALRELWASSDDDDETDADENAPMESEPNDL
jgi:hypothetical protein